MLSSLETIVLEFDEDSYSDPSEYKKYGELTSRDIISPAFFKSLQTVFVEVYFENVSMTFGKLQIKFMQGSVMRREIMG